MNRKHLAFNIPQEAIDITRTFMDAKPWRNGGEDFIARANEWAQGMCSHFQAPPVSVIPVTDMFSYYTERMETPDGTTEARICLHKPSMLVMFNRMGEHLNSTVDLTCEHDGDQGQYFGYSLFYRTNPKMFRARVREGRIPMSPYLLYNQETATALEDYDIDPTDSHALSLLAEAQRAALSDPGTDDDFDADDNDDDTDTDEPISETPAMSTSSDMDYDSLRAMNTRQLRVYATGRGLTGTWSMNKGQILDALGVPAEVR